MMTTSKATARRLSRTLSTPFNRTYVLVVAALLLIYYCCYSYSYYYCCCYSYNYCYYYYCYCYCCYCCYYHSGQDLLVVQGTGRRV